MSRDRDKVFLIRYEALEYPGYKTKFLQCAREFCNKLTIRRNFAEAV